MPHLLAENVCKQFGGVVALRNARFELAAGEVHALMGENGAGKSTLAKILAGSEHADSGTISIDGRAVSIAHPVDARRLGIAIIYQELDLFPHLSVGENMIIGQRRFTSPRRIEEFCRPFLGQVGLDCPVTRTVDTLSIGQMQLVAIARALSQDARVILMDEPTSSLDSAAVARLFGLIRDLKSRGVSMVYVSHKLDEIFQICDRCTVLRDGQTVQTVEVARTTSAELVRLMVGREVEMSEREQRSNRGEVALQVEGLSTARLRDVSFAVRRGEVLGVAGLVGAGRSELGAALFGLDRIASGTVRLRGESYGPRTPSDAIRRAVALVPEDRRLEGLMMSMSVLENSTLATLGRFQKWGVLRQVRERAAFVPVAGRLALRSASPEIPVSTLSGGNQQKALLARWLLLDPDVLFLDDPARGIDVGAKQDIYRIIDELAAAGKAVILVSSELPELLRCCDRILVLREGRVAGCFDAGEATQESIMAAATASEVAH